MERRARKRELISRNQFNAPRLDLNYPPTAVGLNFLGKATAVSADAQLAGFEGSLGAIAHVELTEDVSDVILDRAFGDE